LAPFGPAVLFGILSLMATFNWQSYHLPWRQSAFLSSDDVASECVHAATGTRQIRPAITFGSTLPADQRSTRRMSGTPHIYSKSVGNTARLLIWSRFLRRQIEGETPSRQPAGRRRYGPGKLLESTLIGHGRVEVQIRGVNQQVQVDRVRRIDAYGAGTLDAYAMDHDALFGHGN
jgi:hypothetical protein